MNSISRTSYNDQKPLSGVITTNSDTTNTSSLLVSGNAVIQGNLSISGSLSITSLTLLNLTTTGLLTTNSFNATGTSTFNVPPTMSGALITLNTIPALSIANSSLTQTQVSSGFQFVNLGVQNFNGSKTFNNLLNTTGISDTVSISTPIMNAGYYTATNASIASFSKISKQKAV